MKRINLILGIHNHQPIGNFDSVFVHAHDHAYKPFLDLLEENPAIRLAQHYSGILLDWFRANRPALLAQIRRLVKKGQVEMMGGAYYEAILSVIPDADKMSQLTKLSAAIEKLFGVKPSGMWLAERVWEQHLARCIPDAGLKYIVVDDTHFKYAGFSDDELFGHYVTEEEGRTVNIFPISKVLRYTIPFQPVQRTIDYLRSIATEEGNRIVVFADDGEKFGVWPKTFDHVHTRGWLAEFFKALSDNADWISIIHFREARETIAPLGRTYLPNASYAEMMHWALPAHHFTLYEEFESFLKEQGKLETYGSFFKGGFWRNFLAKYSESNNMHKKMMRVSERARRVGGLKGKKARVPAKTFEKIWASQCNDSYWHGVFGGLYLPVLRYPIYKNLISAEVDLDALEKKKRISVESTDFDCDGRKEILVETPALNCYFKPDVGGLIFELDFKSISLNLLDIVSRREEGYHKKLANASHTSSSGGHVASIHDMVVSKEQGLEKHLNYDWYRRGSLIDHFFGAETTLERLWQCRYPEEGDFVNQPYRVSLRKKGSSLIVELDRHGALWRGEIRHGIHLKKVVTFDAPKNMLNIEYTLANDGSKPVDIWFGSEFNVGLQAGDSPDRYYYSPGKTIEDRKLRSMGEIGDISVLGMRDEWLGVDVRIETELPAAFWRFPLETVSLSESGFERIFQGSVVIPHWRIKLEKEWNCTIIHRFERLKKEGKA